MFPSNHVTQSRCPSLFNHLRIISVDSPEPAPQHPRATAVMLGRPSQALAGVRLILDGHFTVKLNADQLLRFLLTLPDEMAMHRLQFPVVYEDANQLCGFVIIAESHICVHQVEAKGHANPWYGAIDISTCRPDRLDIPHIVTYTHQQLGFVVVIRLRRIVTPLV